MGTLTRFIANDPMQGEPDEVLSSPSCPHKVRRDRYRKAAGVIQRRRPFLLAFCGPFTANCFDRALQQIRQYIHIDVTKAFDIQAAFSHAVWSELF